MVTVQHRGATTMRLILGGACLVGGLILAGSCGSETASGAGGEGPGIQRFGDSACGSCVSEQCATSYQGCDADPGCTTFLQCLLDCPVAPDGYVDEACAA